MPRSQKKYTVVGAIDHCLSIIHMVCFKGVSGLLWYCVSVACMFFVQSSSLYLVCATCLHCYAVVRWWVVIELLPGELCKAWSILSFLLIHAMMLKILACSGWRLFWLHLSSTSRLSGFQLPCSTVRTGSLVYELTVLSFKPASVTRRVGHCWVCDCQEVIQFWTVAGWFMFGQWFD